MGLQLELHRGKYLYSFIMNHQMLSIACLVALAGASPSPDADPHHLLAGHAVAAHPVLPVPVPAANCEVTDVILVTQACTPSAEDVCNTQTIETEEIEYEKLCKEVVDTICDAPHAYHALHKREAEAGAEADPHYGGYVAHAPLSAPVDIAHHVVAPVAHAVAHSVQATVKHACREVTTEHCVDNPKVKLVPVEVEHCHTVTKVTCVDVENKIPQTTCEAIETTHVTHAAPVVHHAAPVVHHAAPVVHAAHHVHAAPLAHGYAGW